MPNEDSQFWNSDTGLTELRKTVEDKETNTPDSTGQVKSTQELQLSLARRNQMVHDLEAALSQIQGSYG